MLVRRKRIRAIGAVMLVVALLLGGAQPASASDCGGFNCYAIGYTTSGGTNWGGGQAHCSTRSPVT